MKYKSSISIAFLLICHSVLSYAQNGRSPEHTLKISLTDFYASTLTLQFENVMAKRFTVQIGSSIMYQQVSLWDNLKGTFKGFAISPEFRYYGRSYYSIMNEPIAPLGIYASIWGRYEQAGLKVETDAQKVELLGGKSYALGILLGWQFWLKFNKNPIFLIDFGMGGGYRFTDYSGRYGAKGRLISFKQKGVLPKLSLTVGIPF